MPAVAPLLNVATGGLSGLVNGGGPGSVISGGVLGSGQPSHGGINPGQTPAQAGFPGANMNMPPPPANGQTGNSTQQMVNGQRMYWNGTAWQATPGQAHANQQQQAQPTQQPYGQNGTMPPFFQQQFGMPAQQPGTMPQMLNNAFNGQQQAQPKQAQPEPQQDYEANKAKYGAQRAREMQQA